VRQLPDVGPKTDARLQAMGVATIGELAALQERFGRFHGEYRHAVARGVDDSPLITAWEPRSLSRKVTFQHDVGRRHVLIEILQELTGDQQVLRPEDPGLLPRRVPAAAVGEVLEPLTQADVEERGAEGLGEEGLAPTRAESSAARAMTISGAAVATPANGSAAGSSVFQICTRSSHCACSWYRLNVFSSASPPPALVAPPAVGALAAGPPSRWLCRSSRPIWLWSRLSSGTGHVRLTRTRHLAGVNASTAKFTARNRRMTAMLVTAWGLGGRVTNSPPPARASGSSN